MWEAIILFIIILGTFLYLDTKKPKNFPPGPKWLPIVGSAIAVYKERQKYKLLYRTITELAKTYSSKEIVGLKTGKDRTVVACGYESIKEMLLNEDLDGRPQGLFYETRTWGIRRGILLTDEEFWQDQRRFVVRHLKEFGFGRRAMADLIKLEAEELLSDMKKTVGTGRIIHMHETFSVYILNTLWSMMAGIRYSVEDKELQTLQSLLSELFANIDMVGSPFSQFPILRYVAPERSGYNRFVAIHQKVWKFLKAELDKHMMNLKIEDEPRDFMDVYIKIIRSPDKKNSFSESQLLAICMDLFMAGSETTSKGLGYGFLYLVLNQDVQRKAQNEIDAVIGRDRLPTLEDRVNLPYCEAIVMEMVRLFMGRTFGIPHRALRDTTLCGYNIPKDTMVISNFNGMLMSPKEWENAEEFQPERYIKDGKIFVPEKYQPFGLGKHRCMGEMMARANSFLFTVTLLQNFTFRVPPGYLQPSLEAIDGATPSCQPYEALVEPRTI